MDAALRAGILRVVLAADGVVLGLFGLGLVLTPRAMFSLFALDLPPAANYIAGMWGALLLTMALGYLLAARQPFTWPLLVQIGLARAALEVLLSLVYIMNGTVSLKQAAAGMFLAVWFALAYLILYPRRAPAQVAL
jgi:hypothetical protein